MSSGFSPSRFNMWRAVVAMMHVDFVVKPHEINFILESIRDLPLTGEQRDILKEDIYNPAPIDQVFHKITNPTDKEDFFHLARALAWADGNLDDSEKNVLDRLGGVEFNITDKSAMTRSRANFEYYMQDESGALKEHDEIVLKMISQLVGR